jgi:hypothetical protein
MRTPGICLRRSSICAEEWLHLLGLEVAQGWIDPGDETVFVLEAEVLMLEIAQALGEQRGRGEQHERHGGLADDERLLHPGAAASDGAVGAAQGFGGICVGGHPCRSYAEEDACKDGDAEGEEEDGPGRRGADGDIVVVSTGLNGEIEDEAGSGDGDAMPRTPPMTARRTLSTRALRTRRMREAPMATRMEICARSLRPRASMRLARLPQATRSTQAAAMKKSLRPSSYSFAHGGDACSARDEVQGLLLPELLFAGLHVGDVAAEATREARRGVSLRADGDRFRDGRGR